MSRSLRNFQYSSHRSQNTFFLLTVPVFSMAQHLQLNENQIKKCSYLFQLSNRVFFLSVVLHFTKNVKKLLRNSEYSKSPKAKKLSVLRITSEARPTFPVYKKCIHSIYSTLFTVKNKNQIIFH